MLDKITNKETFNVSEIEDLVDLFAWSQSAESAAANMAIVSASHLAILVAGFRGEDFGTGYNYEDHTKPRMITYQGDMLLKTEMRPWSNGYVQFCLAPDLSPRVRRMFFS